MQLVKGSPSKTKRGAFVMSEEITEIPEEGWAEEDIGKTVRLKMPHGTVIDDTIVFLEINGLQYIGPATEVGMLLARRDYSDAAIQFYEMWKESMREAMEDLE
jgi:hypothetical protein